MPQIQWLTPIFHPNISAGGSVCLGGYSTHWVPSLKLDQLIEMLWDMICFRNFNLESPFNRDAASWMQQQKTFQFPLEHRPLRQMANSSMDTSPSENSNEKTQKLRELGERQQQQDFDLRQTDEVIFLDPQQQ